MKVFWVSEDSDGALFGDQASIGDERRPLRSGIEDAGASYLAKRRFDLHSHVWAVERIDALERIIDQAAGCERVGRINFDVELHRQTDAEKRHVVTRDPGPFLTTTFLDSIRSVIQVHRSKILSF
jgi:hypothetical protein